MEPQGITTTELRRVAGCSARQIDYWIRAGLVPGQGPVGSGTRRRYTPLQVATVKILAERARLRRELTLPARTA